MALVFRQLLRRSPWERLPGDAWPPADDICADALNSLKTDGNVLSVYVVAETELDRLIGACCANRSNVQTLDYVIIEHDDLSDLGLEFEAVPGELSDAVANNWHRDITHLSARRLTDLAVRLQGRGKLVRRLDKDIGRLINHCIAAGYLSKAKLPVDLVRGLEKPKYREGA